MPRERRRNPSGASETPSPHRAGLTLEAVESTVEWSGSRYIATLQYVSEFDHPYEAAAELFRALGNPVRLSILRELSSSDRCVHEIVDATGVTQPLVSQHLRVLRSARLIVGERRGREIAYRLVDDHVAHIVGDAIAHTAETNGTTKADKGATRP